MIEQYQLGDKLTADDFVSPLYFPPAKWEYVEITDLDENTVTLEYHDFNNPQGTMTKVVTRADMSEMLGWSLGADDNTIDVDDSSKSASREEIAGIIAAPTIEAANGYELVDSNPPAVIRANANGTVGYVKTYATKKAAAEGFRTFSCTKRA